jgi:hypothetical protein
MNPFYIIFPLMLTWVLVGARLLYVIYKLRHENSVNELMLLKAERRIKWFIKLGMPILMIVVLLIYTVFRQCFEWKQN